MPLVQVTVLITLAMLVIFSVVRIFDRYDFKTAVLLSLPMMLGYAAILVWKPDSIILINIGVVLAAVAIGNLIGHPLQTMGSLITFAVTASLVDILSFSGGLTAALIVGYIVGGIYAIPFISGSVVVFLIFQKRRFRSRIEAD